VHVKKEGAKAKRPRITKTDAAYSLLELQSSVVKKEREEILAAHTLLDLENSWHQNENNAASSTDTNHIEEYHADETMENIKFKEVETQVNTIINIHWYKQSRN
jgi:hypothetical protein